MKIFEIGTGYTSIPARMGAATEIVVEELTKSMIKLGEDVSIVDIKDKNRPPHHLPIIEAYMPQFFSSTDTELGIVHKLKRVLYSISLMYKIHSLIRKNKGKEILLHFHNQYNLFFFLKLTSAQLRNKVTIAYTNHSYIWQGEWDDIKEVIRKRYFQEVYCCQNADKVFVLNEMTVEHLTTRLNVDKKKITLIANGVNTETYSPLDDSTKEQLHAKYGLEGKTVFFQAGSICERKNQLASIKLLLPILKQNKKNIFVYAGGVISQEYKQQIDDLVKTENLEGQVLYAGELKPGQTLNEYYNMSSAFIFPSTSEGFSLVILEAMSAGVPVFVDKRCGLKLPNDGDAGCISYKDNNDFVDKINDLIINEGNRKEQSRTARSVIVNGYSWDVIAKKYLERIK